MSKIRTHAEPGELRTVPSSNADRDSERRSKLPVGHVVEIEHLRVVQLLVADDVVRGRLIPEIAKKPCCVTELARLTGQNPGTISRITFQLEQLGILRRQKEKGRMMCRLNDNVFCADDDGRLHVEFVTPHDTSIRITFTTAPGTASGAGSHHSSAENNGVPQIEIRPGRSGSSAEVRKPPTGR